jgi:hypothetical protein
MILRKYKKVLELGISIMILCSVFFLLSSCSSLEFNAHSENNGEHTSSLECHQSTLATTSRNNLILAFVLLIFLFVTNSASYKYLFFKLSNLLGWRTSSYDPPHNFYIVLFSRGILNPKLF